LAARRFLQSSLRSMVEVIDQLADGPCGFLLDRSLFKAEFLP
jgi:hypothetical protein